MFGLSKLITPNELVGHLHWGNALMDLILLHLIPILDWQALRVPVSVNVCDFILEDDILLSSIRVCVCVRGAEGQLGPAALVALLSTRGDLQLRPRLRTRLPSQKCVCVCACVRETHVCLPESHGFAYLYVKVYV